MVPAKLTSFSFLLLVLETLFWGKPFRFLVWVLPTGVSVPGHSSNLATAQLPFLKRTAGVMLLNLFAPEPPMTSNILGFHVMDVKLIIHVNM